jgi:hypothetical protein
VLKFKNDVSKALPSANVQVYVNDVQAPIPFYVKAGIFLVTIKSVV